MASITLKGNPINTIGDLPATGTSAADFTLTKTDLSPASLKDFEGKKVVLNIFPSVDTGICAASVRSFNEKLNSLDNTVVLCISKDLPFAHNRFCEAEGLKNVIPLSDFKSSEFGDAYQVTIKDGPLAGLLSRAIVVIDENGKIVYTEQVPEIVQEPDYDKAVSALS
ncbi:thiol peroxidase [Flexithrix dorotheae]|uniref:thiol peroxidase n=1 Tax=Flexithrix dorotheae TaxID=70993 RepID=UPI00037E518C|nr:thiol peroxidase [Flexithrix dorotheae]